jgi:AcrR family transcriptional regulator
MGRTGRPRSARAQAAVLDAARMLFAGRGIDATTMDAVAAASGVSKATIYKHWPDKDALCLEVMAQMHGHDAALPDVDTGDLRADLVAVLSREPPTAHAEIRARLMPQLMAHAARNPAFGAAWRARVFEPPRTQIGRALRRAVARGDLAAGVDVDLAIALLLGPMLYAHIRRVTIGEAPPGLQTRVVDAFLRSQAPPRRTPPASRRRPGKAARR